MHRFFVVFVFSVLCSSVTAQRDTVLGSENVHFRGHFDHSRNAFRVHKKGTVAFLGGSITEMDGYRVMVQADLKARFPQTEFTFINAGISSTCSTTGAFRLDEDVLAAKPDLLFVEFAVNDDQDASHDERECIRGMEGILRHARTTLPNLDIVVTHFINPPMLEKLQAGETPISSGAHETVAAHYGVSSCDLAREVAQRITAGTITWKEYGGTHPKPPGNRVAANMIADLLNTAWLDVGRSQPLTDTLESELIHTAQRVDKSLPLAKRIDTHSYATGQMVSPSAAQTGEDWLVHRPDWDNLPGATRERFVEMQLLCSSKVGSKCSLKFTGSGIGIFILAGPDAGTIRYSVDGGKLQTLDLYHRYSKGLHYPRTVMLDADLERGQHQIQIEVSESNNEESVGNAVRILKFAVNQ